MTDAVQECHACTKALDDHTLRELREHAPMILVSGVDAMAVVLDTGRAMIPGIRLRFVRPDESTLPPVTLAASERVMRNLRPALAGVIDEALLATRKKRKGQGRDEDAVASIKREIARSNGHIDPENGGEMDDNAESDAGANDAPTASAPDDPAVIAELQGMLQALQQSNAEALTRLENEGRPDNVIRIFAMRLQTLAEYIMPLRNVLEFGIAFERRLEADLQKQLSDGARATLLRGVGGVDASQFKT